MSLAAKCLQVILAVFNLVFLAFGVLLIVGGSTLFHSAAGNQSTEAYTNGLAVMIIGGVSVLIGLFGCFGAFCKSKFLLILYTILVGLLIIAQCVLGGFAMAAVDNDQKISNFAQSVWNSMTPDMRTQYQKDNKCCGYLLPDLTGAANGQCGGVAICAPILKDQLESLIKLSGIYLFVAAGVELVSILIAIILIVDDEKREAGWGQQKY